MKYRYTRFIADLADQIDLHQLVSQLSGLLLSSGFDNPWDPQSDADRALQALHDAILDALLNGGTLSDEMLSRLTSPELSADQQQAQLEELVQRIIEKLTSEGYVSVTGAPEGAPSGGTGEAMAHARFEVTGALGVVLAAERDRG